MRALETGLPVVRAGNSGVTGVILGDGSARWLRGKDGRQLVDAPGVMVETVVVRSSEGIVR
jgi:apolipoprotein N-acyltransferase